ncbi:putative cytochrome P450 E-class, group IV [Cercophora samala]|uniref:Cytochrome P450 E-class, group IV n=1 Tax=Cercophora samala TaxID=330535 RepID=A0AA39ZAH3_9PEZI|nr:putative cytochrome P450 E-class, group IV [Cercophora samala]
MSAQLFIWTAFAVLISAYLLRPKRTPFPIVNKYPNDFLGRRAAREAQENARKLITEGLAKHQGPIAINLLHGQKIILPASLAGWVKSNKDLDHKQLVKDDYFAGIPGFEAQSVLHGDDETPKRLIITKLGQNDSTMGVMNESLARGFRALWGDDTEWHAINWHQDTGGIIARAASSVFVGPELADDGNWLGLVQGYVTSYFMAVYDLHAYPAWTRSIVHWFLPNAKACRKTVPQVRAIVNDVLRKRQDEVDQAKREGKSAPEYNDALAWAQAASKGNIEPGDLQLSLAMAAFFTTAEMFRAILVDIVRHPELVEPLRKEVWEQISAHGISVAAANNMVLLDSFMKESQRLSSGLVVLERAVLKDTALPDGRILPRGSQIMVDSTNIWDSNTYPNPDQFDGYRFLRKREAGDTTSQFVQTSQDFHVFGGGRHICPGRFFASNELKLALAHILLKYDIRFAEGCDPKPIMNGFYAMVDPTVRLEVKRRMDGAAEGILGERS